LRQVWLLDKNDEVIPVTSTPLGVRSIHNGDRVFTLQSNAEDPVGQIAYNSLRYIVKNYTQAETVFSTMYFTLGLDKVVTAWGRDFGFGVEPEQFDLDLELEIECGPSCVGGTITLQVPEPVNIFPAFSGFCIMDDDDETPVVVSSIKFKSRNAINVPNPSTYFGLDDVCAEIPPYDPDYVCKDINCDFSALTPNALTLTTPKALRQAINESCGMNVYHGGFRDNLNVFDSGNITNTTKKDRDADLGSPNIKCRPRGPGRGSGGGPNATFPNCEPLGKILKLRTAPMTTPMVDASILNLV
jgi:hypothetical protein